MYIIWRMNKKRLFVHNDMRRRVFFYLMGLSHQKQLLPYGRDSCFAWNRCHIFMKKAWNLWHESQTTCVLLLNFRTFMETPFALNSLPLRQRARWRIRSQVSLRKTCKASALYTIGFHAFFHKYSEYDSIANP